VQSILPVSPKFAIGSRGWTPGEGIARIAAYQAISPVTSLEPIIPGKAWCRRSTDGIEIVSLSRFPLWINQ
jgi:hypothetical protein